MCGSILNGCSSAGLAFAAANYTNYQLPVRARLLLFAGQSSAHSSRRLRAAFNCQTKRFLFPREDDAAACLTARMRVVFEGARRARRASAYRALTFCEQGENLPSSRRQYMGKAFLQRRRPPAILADCVLTPRRFHETIVMFLMQQLGPCTERWF